MFENWNGGLIEMIHCLRENQMTAHERLQAGQLAQMPAPRPPAKLPFVHPQEESEAGELDSLLAEIENITKGEI